MKLKKLTQSCIFTVCEVYTNVTDQILIKSLCMSKPGILFLKHNISNSNIYVFINLIHFKGVYGRFLLLVFFCFFFILLLNFLVFFFIQMARLFECLVGDLCSFIEVRVYYLVPNMVHLTVADLEPPPKIRKAYVIQR